MYCKGIGGCWSNSHYGGRAQLGTVAVRPVDGEREAVESLQTPARKPGYHGVQEYAMIYAHELVPERIEKGLVLGLEQRLRQ